MQKRENVSNFKQRGVNIFLINLWNECQKSVEKIQAFLQIIITTIIIIIIIIIIILIINDDDKKIKLINNNSNNTMPRESRNHLCRKIRGANQQCLCSPWCSTPRSEIHQLFQKDEKDCTWINFRLDLISWTKVSKIFAWINFRKVAVLCQQRKFQQGYKNVFPVD